MNHYDVVIVGAGMAGASLAAEIAHEWSVAIVETESVAGYHATGRSAAFWTESYGGPHIQPLTTASGPWLTNPPAAYGGASFVSPRGAINLGREADVNRLVEFASGYARAGVAMHWLDRSALDERCAGLRAAWNCAVEEPSCADIDVAALHQACLRVARQAGATLLLSAGLTKADYRCGRWRIDTAGGPMTATTLINAAGAWADDVATRSGVDPIGITPLRRTMVQLRLDRDVPRDLPLMIDINGQFYFKSDGAGGVWLSPHDEIPTPAVDAAPDELDVAVAIDRFEAVVDWRVMAVTHKWAGLRSFAPDRLPVYGFDPAQPAFFWCAGQGGFGIQTAPAAAKLCANLLIGGLPDPMLGMIDPARYAPGRVMDSAI